MADEIVFLIVAYGLIVSGIIGVLYEANTNEMRLTNKELKKMRTELKSLRQDVIEARKSSV